LAPRGIANLALTIPKELYLMGREEIFDLNNVYYERDGKTTSTM